MSDSNTSDTGQSTTLRKKREELPDDLKEFSKVSRGVSGCFPDFAENRNL